MPERHLPLALSFLLLLAGLRPLTAAQELIELRGTVADETGASIVGASVTLEDIQKYITRTDGQGRYHIRSMAPGKYRLKVAAQGFATFIKELDLTERHSAPLDIV